MKANRIKKGTVVRNKMTMELFQFIDNEGFASQVKEEYNKKYEKEYVKVDDGRLVKVDANNCVVYQVIQDAVQMGDYHLKDGVLTSSGNIIFTGTYKMISLIRNIMGGALLLAKKDGKYVFIVHSSCNESGDKFKEITKCFEQEPALISDADKSDILYGIKKIGEKSENLQDGTEQKTFFKEAGVLIELTISEDEKWVETFVYDVYPESIKKLGLNVVEDFDPANEKHTFYAFSENNLTEIGLEENEELLDVTRNVIKSDILVFTNKRIFAIAYGFEEDTIGPLNIKIDSKELVDASCVYLLDKIHKERETAYIFADKDGEKCMYLMEKRTADRGTSYEIRKTAPDFMN